MSDSVFIHAEAALVETLGLSRKEVRAIRTAELSDGVDWKHEGGQIRYSDGGRERLLDLLKISAQSTPPAEPSDAEAAEPDVVLSPVAPDPRAPAKPNEEHELLITKKFLNRGIVQAKHGAAFVRVRVKDSRTLHPGTFIRCQLIEGDLWRMTQRLPRK